MEGVTTAIGGITGIMTSLLDFITGNPILMVFFVAGFVGTAIGLIRKFKR